MDAVDAREILNHLNHLGYRNITTEQLKEFQKDLTKLIKFDTKQGADEDGQDSDFSSASNVFERLHTEKTISYRAKLASSSKSRQPAEATTMDKENQNVEPTTVASNERIAPKMWIRPKSQHSIRRGDPVALYHSYQKDWNKFKQKLPGENDHSELRWKIRSKLLGE